MASIIDSNVPGWLFRAHTVCAGEDYWRMFALKTGSKKTS
jgi:hypothetical protein